MVRTQQYEIISSIPPFFVEPPDDRQVALSGNKATCRVGFGGIRPHITTGKSPDGYTLYWSEAAFRKSKGAIHA
ncbi:hypothetical protein G3N95_06555 [Paraburkholderia sp. Tr-20389]|uniref:hypothetical protein n=1 Tax=Paraburkholderia sp. Tr-20389 TaxID=2703903 RepID=UPI00197F7843|nr:hypothetical protein [Paraburkholderia sp. Tr-20389]MBN3752594.1 hypothetical protein [Paraburkholderia sp. Tr-20389]